MNLSDRDLDRLFREAADRFEPDDSMLSWNRLEKNLAGKLPERPPGPPRRFGFRPVIWVPAAVLCAGLSFLLIKNHQPYRSLSTLPSSTLTRPVSPAPAAGASSALPSTGTVAGDVLKAANERSEGDKSSSASKKTSAAKAPEKTGSGTASETPGTGAPAALSPPVTNSADKAVRGSKSSRKTFSSLAANRPEALPATPSVAPNPDLISETGNRRSGQRFNPAAHSGMASVKKAQRKTAGGGKGITSGRDKNANTDSGDLPAGTSNDVSAGTGPVGDVGISAATAETGSARNDRTDKTNIGNNPSRRTEFAKTTLPSPVRHAGPSVPDDRSALALEAAQNKQLITPSRSVQVRNPLTIGLVMGPDYTDGGVTSNQLGNSVGLSIAYYLSSRLSVNSGILYGVKSYSAKGQDFPPPREPLRPYGSYPHAESANGTVTLFEIPLSLRYDFPIDSKTRLFVNAGLSSYLPLKETLTSYYHEQNFTFGWRHVNDNPPSHWFAIGHFSGGIERDLGKGLSFQVEPYLNLPFTNVCTGNVKLNTYGVLISIRFSPILSRKKQ